MRKELDEEESEEESTQFDPDIELTTQMDLDPYLASTSFQWPKWAKQLIEAAGDGVGDPNEKRRTRFQY